MRTYFFDSIGLFKKALRTTAEKICLCLAIPIYSILRALIPTRKSLIALMSVPDFSDNALAMFEVMQHAPESGNFQFVWLVKHPPNEEPKFSDRNVFWVKKNSLAGLFWFMRSRIVFFTHGTYRFVRVGWHQTLVNLWHGMPIKKIGTFLDKRVFLEPPFSHWTVATSSYFGDLIATAFSVPRKRVLVAGLPRNEWLFRTDPEHMRFKDGGDTLVVWLPTYREYDLDGYQLHDAAGSDRICPSGVTEIDNGLNGTGVRLLLKFHPADVRNHQQWPALKNITILTAREFQRSGLNIYRLLGCADALITDFSSIAIDYLITGKPVVLFGADEGSYLRGLFPAVFQRMLQVSFRADTVDELIRLLRDLPRYTRDADAREFLHEQKLTQPSAAILRAIQSPLAS
jgi:CDP-glycerol glycerophosphotransferase (TagB/SpsB family)